MLESAASLSKEGIHSIPVFFFTSGSFKATVHGSSDQETFAKVFRAAEKYWKSSEEIAAGEAAR